MTDTSDVTGQHGYGWHPSLPDLRDFPLAAAPGRVTETTPPSKVDLSGFLPPVRDQGQLGSCTGFGATNAYYATSKRNGRFPIPFSALFSYYCARALEGTTKVDAGATVRDVVKGLARWGAAPEDRWPYVISNFDDRPTAGAYNAALRHQAISYYAVTQTSLALRQALAAGYPVIIGFAVYESFESAEVARTGRVPMPTRGERVLGGHCVVLYGYDMGRPADQRFDGRNQWGTGWGRHGDFTMPDAFLTNPQIAGDFWTLRVTEG